MAAYAARAGIPSAVLLPHGRVSREQLTQAITYGARVIEIETDFDGCMRLVQELAADRRIYLLNSMNSIRIEGQKAIGIETLEQLGWRVPGYFAVPVGNAGNLSALGKGLRELREIGVIDRLPRLVGAQAEQANPLYRSFKNGFAPLEPIAAGATVASAMQIGNPVSFTKAVRELKASNGLVEQASEEEIMDARAVVDQSGIAICPNSATAVAAVRKLRVSGAIEEGTSVVVMLTGHGAKFSESARRYHAGATSRFANTPAVVEANLGAVRKALGM
jgi:threonine synthase